MDMKIVDDALNNLVERLAAIEHERWAHWQTCVHSKATRMSDGSLVLPPELVTRWERQLGTAYADLGEEEKQSDREQIQRYLPLIRKSLIQALGSTAPT